MTLYTIGYEGATPADFWATLALVGVKTIIDVRDVPYSRKPGFSKKALEREAASAGVKYVHLAALGDPKEGREAAKAGKYALFRDIFCSHMQRPEAVSALDEAVNLSYEAPSCLLCYERKHEHCHRSIVAAQMAEDHELNIRHIGVKMGLAVAPTSRSEYHGAGELIFGRI